MQSDRIRNAIRALPKAQYAAGRSAYVIRLNGRWHALGYGGNEREALDAAVDRLSWVGWTHEMSATDAIRLLAEHADEMME